MRSAAPPYFCKDMVLKYTPKEDIRISLELQQSMRPIGSSSNIKDKDGEIMKMTIVKLLAVVLTVMVLTGLTGCHATKGDTPDKHQDHSEQQSQSQPQQTPPQQVLPQVQPTFSNEEIIDSFVPSSFNCVTLSVGDSHKPNCAIWLSSGMGTVYSSDESVVTVTTLGKVTAVGAGEAYVIIRAGTMYDVVRYTVTG